MKLYKFFTIVAVLAVAATAAYADAWNVDTGGFFEEGSGAVIQGYDPVAYFTEGKAVEGSQDYTANYRGGTFRFASVANKDLFTKNPGKYAPQYGGFCAYAVSQGTTAGIDPQAWTVHNGKLYLNYSKSVQKTWLEDVEDNIADADDNWQTLKMDASS